jgi:hypothetical protein
MQNDENQYTQYAGVSHAIHLAAMPSRSLSMHIKSIIKNVKQILIFI